MNRHHTQKHYLELIDKIRACVPGVAISTDIIVGFPGETEDDFMETVRVMESVGYDMAYTARYSPRPGTIIAKYMKDAISHQEKKRRERYLEEILRKSALARNKEYVGREVEVLVESVKTRNSKVGSSLKPEPTLLTKKPQLQTTDQDQKQHSVKEFLGKTRTGKTVAIFAENDAICAGTISHVIITRAREFGLEGKLF
jgi:tRNA A37 methylthiotransferase MiaB